MTVMESSNAMWLLQRAMWIVHAFNHAPFRCQFLVGGERHWCLWWFRRCSVGNLLKTYRSEIMQSWIKLLLISPGPLQYFPQKSTFSVLLTSQAEAKASKRSHLQPQIAIIAKPKFPSAHRCVLSADLGYKCQHRGGENGLGLGGYWHKCSGEWPWQRT